MESHVQSAHHLTSPTPFLSDGGLETWLIYTKGHHLPLFAAFPLLATPGGCRDLQEYYTQYLQDAEVLGMGSVLSTPTWRSSTRWGEDLGYTQEQVDWFNKEAVKLVKSVAEVAKDGMKIVVDGQIGPMEDGYRPEAKHCVEACKNYHKRQVEVLSEAGVDIVTAATLTTWEEGVGVAMAARECGVQMAVGFTVELDGKLPSGDTLEEAIKKVDKLTDEYPSYYMVNCAHPDHITKALEKEGKWKEKVKAFRVNASRKSHEELDSMDTLDEGDVDELGDLTVKLGQMVPHTVLLGGCCGTRADHIRNIGQKWKQAREEQL